MTAPPNLEFSQLQWSVSSPVGGDYYPERMDGPLGRAYTTAADSWQAGHAVSAPATFVPQVGLPALPYGLVPPMPFSAGHLGHQSSANSDGSWSHVSAPRHLTSGMSDASWRQVTGNSVATTSDDGWNQVTNRLDTAQIIQGPPQGPLETLVSVGNLGELVGEDNDWGFTGRSWSDLAIICAEAQDDTPTPLARC